MKKEKIWDRLNHQVTVKGTPLSEIAEDCAVSESKLYEFFKGEDSLSFDEQRYLSITLAALGWKVYQDGDSLKSLEELIIELPLMPEDMEKLEKTKEHHVFYWGGKEYKRFF
ncbi:MAG: hypothetical protein WD530_02075 [Vicingaceae bacterium]